MNVKMSSKCTHFFLTNKSLLKKFHPDKFANEPEKQKEATEITSSITSAFTRIKTWYEQNLPKS